MATAIVRHRPRLCAARGPSSWLLGTGRHEVVVINVAAFVAEVLAANVARCKQAAIAVSAQGRADGFGLRNARRNAEAGRRCRSRNAARGSGKQRSDLSARASPRTGFVETRAAGPIVDPGGEIDAGLCPGNPAAARERDRYVTALSGKAASHVTRERLPARRLVDRTTHGRVKRWIRARVRGEMTTDGRGRRLGQHRVDGDSGDAAEMAAFCSDEPLAL
jgi:hypothetical protein